MLIFICIINALYSVFFLLVSCVLVSHWLTQSLIVILPRSAPLQHSWRESFSCYSYAPWKLLVWRWGNAWIAALLAQDSLRISAEPRGIPRMPNNWKQSVAFRHCRREDGHTGRKGTLGETRLLMQTNAQVHVIACRSSCILALIVYIFRDAIMSLSWGHRNCSMATAVILLPRIARFIYILIWEPPRRTDFK